MIARLLEHPTQRFADQTAWNGHLNELGISALKVNPDPVLIATEGALWGSVKAHGFLPDTVIVSDDAGQFDVGLHALCWVHYLESDLILSVETEGPTCRGISPKRLKIKNRKSKSELQERKEIWLGFQWLGRVRLDTGMLTRFEGRRTSSSGLSPSRLVVAARTRWSRIATKPVPGCRSATDAPALSHTPPLGRSPEFIWSPGEPKAPIHWRWERIPKIRFDSR